MTPPEGTSPALAGKGPDIFQLRLESATWSLENLASVLKSIQGRADAVRELQKKLAEDRNQISETLSTLESYLKRLGELANADVPKSGPLRREVENAMEEFQALQKHIADARGRATGIFFLQSDPLSLNQSEKEFTAKVEASRVQVGELDLTASANRGASWKKLKDLGSVWIEYLDYLAGLCLRYEGLDSAICEIGDALIHELKRSAGELGALAVPGRESAAAIRPNLVFLRFPEWTVWALPLAAHELWHVAANQPTFRNNLQIFLNQRLDAPTLAQRGDDPLLEDCLADAFATYTMGPAYACAALSLALDPLSENDQQRAHAILAMLKSASHAELTKPHEWVHATLTTLWSRATDQAGQQLCVPDPRLEKWTQALIEYLSRPQWPINLKFPVERWVAVRLKWVEALLKDTVESLDLDGRSLRLALNAAWFARLERPQRSFADIAANCNVLCLDIMKRGAAAPAPTPRDWPPYGR